MKDRNVAMNVVEMKEKKSLCTGGEIYYILRVCGAMPVAGCLGVHDAGKQSYAERVGERVAHTYIHTYSTCTIGFAQNFPNSKILDKPPRQQQKWTKKKHMPIPPIPRPS